MAKKAWRRIAISAGLLVFGSAITLAYGFGVRGWQLPSGRTAHSFHTDEQISMRLKTIADEVNRDVPKQIGDAVLVGARADPGKMLTYRYIVPQHLAQKLEFRSFSANLVEEVCQAQGPRELLELGVALGFAYEHPDSTRPATIVVRLNDCAVATARK